MIDKEKYLIVEDKTNEYILTEEFNDFQTNTDQLSLAAKKGK